MSRTLEEGLGYTEGNAEKAFVLVEPKRVLGGIGCS